MLCVPLTLASKEPCLNWDAVDPEFLLMDDNAWPRLADVVSEYLQTEDTTQRD
ncbi:hypothetical protein X975_26898, partial [Stegodyphus mimosarum]